ncbi:RNA-binding La domain protein [Madurella fahalii]|uniref:RNA-binding La domain protein n=1 Tax=Madurella fahalii TaxID=1157608 RepID=A0ABQ0GMC3_9PEZI
MSEAAVKDQPQAAPAAAATTNEAQPVQESTSAAETTEQNGEKTEAASRDQNGADKKTDAASKGQNGADQTAGGMLKTRGQIDRQDFKKNRKYDPSTQPVTDDPVKIRNQVEFYFSDSNLPGDKFMWESTGGEENKPISLKTICNFKRMHKFQPYTAVVAALRDSTFLEVSGEEGQEVVKRKKAYTSSSDAQKAKLHASVYVKGFGDEEPSTQFDIEAFFAPYGPVNLVKLRRTAEDFFKGSVFVEFASAELADAFVKLDPAPTWKGHELLIMKKLDYLEEKNRQIKEGLLEPSSSRQNAFWEGKEKGSRGGRGGARGRGRGRDGKSDDWKKRREDDQKNGFKNGRSRGRGRGGRGGRDNQNRGREEKKTEEVKKNTNDVQIPTIQSTAETNGKRAREDDGDSAPPAKKVDTKPEAVAAQ